MEILILIVLILLGLLFLLVELLLLPGLSVGGILSMGCYGWAIYLAFNSHSMAVGITVCVLIAILSLISVVISLRAKTWQRLSLKDKIESQSSTTAQHSVTIGSEGITLSRLAPMGKIAVNGVSYEAKSQGGYVDSNCAIEVIGHEDSVVIVKIKN